MVGWFEESLELLKRLISCVKWQTKHLHRPYAQLSVYCPQIVYSTT